MHELEHFFVKGSEGFLEGGLLAVKRGSDKGSQKGFLEGGFQKVPTVVIK